MRTMLVVAAFAVCAASLPAQDSKKYEREGKFTAKFPIAPDETVKSAGGVTAHIFIGDYEKGKGVFMVTYSDLPPEVLKAPKPEQVLESSEKGLTDKSEKGLTEFFKVKITKSGPALFGPKKYPAREIAADREELSIRGTIVLVGPRLYQVFVLGSKEFMTNKAADDFLASFAITD
jgi:hypothetical protein